VFAKRLGGEPAVPQHGPWVFLSAERMAKHLLVLGATGAGKTETLLRLAWTVASASDARVFYLDGKGDRENAKRFLALMSDAGRHTRVFPLQRFDMWRGEAHEIHARLMEIVDYSSAGPAAWYRDIAATALRLVCDHPDGPPPSSGVLLHRLTLGGLRSAHPGSTAAASLSDEQVSQVRLRYEAFFGQTRGQLDGAWSWEDTTAGYLMLDTLALGKETAGLARCLFTDFSHYFTARKPRSEFCVMIVDEFSALARGGGMAARVEQARGFHTALVLAPQVIDGMGGPEEMARIVGSVETIICHRVNTPHDIVRLAGTRQRPEMTTRVDEHGPTAQRTVRMREQLTIDPNKIPALPAGAAYIISHGRAMRAQILRSPGVSVELPLPDTTTARDVPKQTLVSQPVLTSCEPEDELPF
jgi:Helicase HerA, central domain